VGRRLLLSLPAVAATIVAWALLGAGGERVRYVQVLGGPTREGARLSVLLRAIELDGERRLPIPRLALRMVAAADAAGDSPNVNVSGTTDDTGHVEALLDFGRAPSTSPWLRVEAADSGATLAEGVLALEVEPWRVGARRDGGWLAGQTRGVLRVRVAAESGVLAVPFAGQLVLEVRAPDAGAVANAGDDGLPLAGAIVRMELDGAELLHVPAPTDAAGQTRVALRPLEHAISARVIARAGERIGEWYGALPVVPGALVASLAGDQLSVRSPIARELAYLSLVSEHERIAGAIVPLALDADGSSSGSVALEPTLRARLNAEPLWAVVSSEYDKRSPGVVGWPLSPPFDAAAPRLTFNVADRVLLDGRTGALWDVSERQLARRRRAAAGLLGVGALMSLAFWSEVRRSGRRRGPANGVSGGDATERAALAPRGWLLGMALVCIIVGLGALAYFGLLVRP
jgi:hypothetical protein